MDKVNPLAYLGTLPATPQKPRKAKYIPWDVAADAAIKVIEERYGVTINELESSSRQRHLVYLRHMYFYWMCRRYKKSQRKTFSYEKLGITLGRERTTVIHAEERYQHRIDTKEPLPEELNKMGLTTDVDYKFFHLITLMKCS